MKKFVKRHLSSFFLVMVVGSLQGHTLWMLLENENLNPLEQIIFDELLMD